MINIIIEIRCNTCPRAAFTSPVGSSDRAAVARRVAEATPGWLHDAKADRDHCPECRKLMTDLNK